MMNEFSVDFIFLILFVELVVDVFFCFLICMIIF